MYIVPSTLHLIYIYIYILLTYLFEYGKKYTVGKSSSSVPVDCRQDDGTELLTWFRTIVTRVFISFAFRFSLKRSAETRGHGCLLRPRRKNPFLSHLYPPPPRINPEPDRTRCYNLQFFTVFFCRIAPIDGLPQNDFVLGGWMGNLRRAEPKVPGARSYTGV